MRYFLIAGEASGDLHASNLIRALKAHDPKAEFYGLGGDLMRAQGVYLVKHYRKMAFMGIIQVIKNARTILSNLRDCKKSILEFQPNAVILVDYPSFNLKIAKFIKKQTSIPVFFYISPKIWAWKKYRIKAIKKYIDKMFCILPFEVDFYAKLHYTVQYTGNPTMDSIREFKQTAKDKNMFFKTNNIPIQPTIALLAGSRKNEISKCLPKMLNMVNVFPQYRFIIAGSPGIDADFYKKFTNEIPVVFGQTYALVQASYAAVVNSGTATLETALIGTPQVVVYHVFGDRIASLMRKIILHIPFISLVNLIAGKEVVSELVAHSFTTKALEKSLRQLLYDIQYRQNQIDNYHVIEQKLGYNNCAETTAKLLIENLSK